MKAKLAMLAFFTKKLRADVAAEKTARERAQVEALMDLTDALEDAKSREQHLSAQLTRIQAVSTS